MSVVIPYNFNSNGGSSGSFTEYDVSQYFHYAGGNIYAKLLVSDQLSFLAVATEQTSSTVEHVNANSGLSWGYSIPDSQIPQSVRRILFPKFLTFGEYEYDYSAVSAHTYTPYPSIHTETSFRTNNGGYYTITFSLQNTSDTSVALPTDIKIRFSASYINQT